MNLPNSPFPLRFLDYLTAFNWVYVVSVEQLVAWVKDPVPLSEMGNHPAFQCSSGGTLRPETCKETVNCEYNSPLPITQQTIYMKICSDECPAHYPYLDNVDGQNPY